MILINLIGFLLAHLVSNSECSNITDKYMSMDERSLHGKQGRFITFHTEDDEIEVELEFAVPFIKIPVKQSLDMAKGAMANINLGAMAMAGIISVVVAIILPMLLSFFNNKLFIPLDSGSGFSTNFYRSNRNSNEPDVWRYLNILDEILMGHNIDTTSCMQRMICRIIKNSSSNVSNGKGTSMDKILDGLATNEWIQSTIVDTPFHSALKIGLDDSNCSKEYDNCKVTRRIINNFAKYFIKAINGD